MCKTCLIVVLTALVIGIAACTSEKASLVPANTGCDTTYYALTIKPIIETHCMGNNSGCHINGGSGNGDFNKYLVLKDKVDNLTFNQRVLQDKDMPPPGTPLPQLDDADRTLLENWVNDGAIGCD